MNKAIRIALGSGVLAAGLAFAAAPASAQVAFRGSFPLPHGRISIGVGQPAFTVGGFVPEGYSVYDDPQFGYGFYAGDEWIPCEQSAGRWIIVERPTRFAVRDYGYVRPYRTFGRETWQEGRRVSDNRRDFASRNFERDGRGTDRNTRQFRDDRSSRDEQRTRSDGGGRQSGRGGRGSGR
jgi:hypothetical protein